ncbi:uncharacterized protein RCH25_049004 [Pelodytes ibericus]
MPTSKELAKSGVDDSLQATPAQSNVFMLERGDQIPDPRNTDDFRTLFANLASSITSALRTSQVIDYQTEEPQRAISGRKATSKTKHIPQNDNPDMVRHVKEGAMFPRKRAPHRAKSVRRWKRAKTWSQSDSSSESEGEIEGSDLSDEDEPVPCNDPIDPEEGTSSEPLQAMSDSTVPIDPKGEPLFSPEDLQHPRSLEWAPTAHIAEYIASRVRKPLDRATRNQLRAECPRPTVANTVCVTPEVDPKIAQFLGKTGWKTRKGLDFSLKNCQDKILDVLGPITKIFELVEAAIVEGTSVNPDCLRGWAQMAICLLGNANSALATERRKAILLKIEPKLVNMAISEPGPKAKGLLFGDSFVKELGAFVQTFTALDKAQSNMRRVFNQKVFVRAGRTRGRLAGRSFRGQSRGPRGLSQNRQLFQEYRPQNPTFFPQRG